jgi:hypothetical protein
MNLSGFRWLNLGCSIKGVLTMSPEKFLIVH